jgi:ribose-phosphate pyrophosphokinase
MISTGGTVVAAIKALQEKGCTEKIYVAATHGLFTGDAADKLMRLPVERIFVSDSFACNVSKNFPLEIVSLAKPIAERIESLSEPRPHEAVTY